MAAIWPYIVLTRLGVLPAAHGEAIYKSAVLAQVNELMVAFAIQLFLYVLALAIIHFADVKFRGHLQQRILNHLGRAPLSWFSNHASGRVRKALQGDTQTLHTLVAHQPVEMVAAVVTPLSLMVYAFILNPWLGLLSIAPPCCYTFSTFFLWPRKSALSAKTDRALLKAAEVAACVYRARQDRLMRSMQIRVNSSPQKHLGHRFSGISLGSSCWK